MLLISRAEQFGQPLSLFPHLCHPIPLPQLRGQKATWSYCAPCQHSCPGIVLEGPGNHPGVS